MSFISYQNLSEDDQQAARDLLDQVVLHVPFDGWTQACLEMAARDCDMSDDRLAALLPKGMTDAIALASQIADEDMVTAFHALEEPPAKMHLKIRTLILLRLTQAIPHKEAVRRTMSALATPLHAPMSSALLYQTVDHMWRAAGDDATDASFYTKRATLAAVYSATLLAFLGDDSADMAKTEAFLDRRLADVAKIPKVTGPIKQMAGQIGGMMQAVMARRNAS